MTSLSPSLTVVDYLRDLGSTELSKFVDSDGTWGVFIFRDQLPLKLLRTGKRAITVSNDIGISHPTRDYGTRVSVRLYSDHTRDNDGDAATEDGIDRAWAMLNHVDFHLHSPKPLLDGSVVVQSNRDAGPIEAYDQNQDLPYLTLNYSVTVHSSKE